ncbi:MAG: MutS-related protein [Rhizomicrobium sp.]
MKANLLHPDRDFDWKAPSLWNEDTLMADLGLDALFDAMADGDACILNSARKVILSGTGGDPETIRYRQEIVRDCLDHPLVLRQIYAIAVEAKEKEKGHYLGGLNRYPHWLLRDAIEQMKMFVGMFRKLRRIVDSHAGKFVSRGCTTLCATVQHELDDEYLARADAHLEQLNLDGQTALSAALDSVSRGTNYVLHRSRRVSETWWESKWRQLRDILFPPNAPPLSFTLHPRDEGGARALDALRDRGICDTAIALAQSRDRVRNYFAALRQELAFYIGCINLHERLTRKKAPICLPTPSSPQERQFSFCALTDLCLLLERDGQVTANDMQADERTLVVVTGANQGGKSTFLRSVGIAQVMMQCGMFVTAESFRSGVCSGIFTHYRREEDIEMKSGKFDEELERMSDIVDHVTRDSMVLLNESFATTNEREGSEIGRQVITALSDNSVRVVCVTHLYEMARELYERNGKNLLFLRAERKADGTRTFRMIEGEPLPTSHGPDLYNTIFGADAREKEAGDGRSAARTA